MIQQKAFCVNSYLRRSVTGRQPVSAAGADASPEGRGTRALRAGRGVAAAPARKLKGTRKSECPDELHIQLRKTAFASLTVAVGKIFARFIHRLYDGIK